MQTALNLVRAYAPDDFSELERPALRHVDLEVVCELVVESSAEPTLQLEDPWFAGSDLDLERARSIIKLGDDANEEYLPERRSYRVPIAVGVGIVAAAATLCVIAF